MLEDQCCGLFCRWRLPELFHQQPNRGPCLVCLLTEDGAELMVRPEVASVQHLHEIVGSEAQRWTVEEGPSTETAIKSESAQFHPE